MFLEIISKTQDYLEGVSNRKITQMSLYLEEILSRGDIHEDLREVAYFLYQSIEKDALLFRGTRSTQRVDFKGHFDVLLAKISTLLRHKARSVHCLPQAYILIIDLAVSIESNFPGYDQSKIEDSNNEVQIAGVSTAEDHLSAWVKIPTDTEIVYTRFKTPKAQVANISEQVKFTVPKSYIEQKILTGGIWGVCQDSVFSDKRIFLTPEMCFNDSYNFQTDSFFERIYLSDNFYFGD